MNRPYSPGCVSPRRSGSDLVAAVVMKPIGGAVHLRHGTVNRSLVGWLVAHFTHIAWLFPLGALVGLILAIVLIVYKYGRP